MNTSSARASFTGLLVTCVASLMLFSALTSAMVARRGLGGDWRGIDLPPAIWLASVAIGGSGLLLAYSRRNGSAAGWRAGMLLGCCFPILQAWAWQSLPASGIAGSFFYVLSAVHAAHACAALVALVAFRRRAADLTLYFWHFTGLLWLYILLLFGVWA